MDTGDNTLNKLKFRLILFVFLPVFSANVMAYVPAQITANEAYRYVGESTKVCGIYAQFKHHDQLNYFNIDEPYPRNSIAFVVFNSDLDFVFDGIDIFSISPGQTKVCAYGKIKPYKNRLQIIVRHPKNIEFKAIKI